MRNMDRWLGDGGMPLIADLGASFRRYGEGWAEADWEPTARCCNPGGTVQAGVQSVLLDAAMNFALLASLESGERGATLEMKVSTLRPAQAGDRLTVRGEVLRLGRRVAYLQAFTRAAGGSTGNGAREGGEGGGDGHPQGGEVIAHATATFALFRPEPG